MGGIPNGKGNLYGIAEKCIWCFSGEENIMEISLKKRGSMRLCHCRLEDHTRKDDNNNESNRNISRWNPHRRLVL